MPIFHDQSESPIGSPQQPPSSAELPRDGYRTGSPTRSSRKANALSRVELIERIKRGNSPSWPQLHNASLGNCFPIAPRQLPRPASRDLPSTPLHSPAGLKSPRTSTPDPLRDHASAGIEIERPRSALHSGDFREEKDETKFDNRTAPAAILATSPVVPWHQSFPAAALPTSRAESPFSFHSALDFESRSVAHSRPISQLFASSFVFMPPTSPLVQQSNNTDLDFSSRPGSRQSSKSPDRGNRRHTFSPHSFQTFRGMSKATGTPGARHLRKEATFPYQAHQPRRSLTTLSQVQPHSSPQTPLVQSRRPSFSSEASPLHHAPMVGSYEESILRGRMSTTPSRPLNFVAQIGVLGKGQCKSNLRCPPHVTVPFPAVFYSYNSGNGRIADDSPSPYVGLIDLENTLSAPDESGELSRRKRRHTIPHPDQDDLDFRLPHEDHVTQPSKEDIRRKEKKKRRSTSPKAPPGGCYRIPEQGQLQIVLKNPNKTAVKLYLVPYDLSDMEPGQKTFIRQRSYSAGPIIDMPLSTRKNFGTDRPEASLSNSDDPNDRPILRYLIHLHICCPSKGRYYLYKSIRVVFANRVPDGKEKLRNEIQLPEPRYSTYKANRDSLALQSTSVAGAQLAAEKAFRRSSAGFSLSHQTYDRMDGINARPPLPPPAIQFSGGNPYSPSPFGSPMSAMEPIPFNLNHIPTAVDSRPVSRDPMMVEDDSPFQSRTNGGWRPSTPTSSGVGSPGMGRTDSFEKLSKGDVGYGGNAFCGVRSPDASPTTGLLAMSLRGLDAQRRNLEDDDGSF
ncbi:hypothetical protein P154DRAFT_442989 [Amniculicola lignicola CBS 123094]|uniref:Atos-like conserved domain-containing protein n=1 Tax=Amniculicola lignicola CBS 123094 TaxID=1392246 RepID=A0A6A5W466_9PLEO|nr:hypothetical protein P154DRAFT_442989 [Amniculicola lignicola CBS 123094]